MAAGTSVEMSSKWLDDQVAWRYAIACAKQRACKHVFLMSVCYVVESDNYLYRFLIK